MVIRWRHVGGNRSSAGSAAAKSPMRNRCNNGLMPTRKPIVGGNWKMHTDLASARALAGEIVLGVSGDAATSCDVVVFPPFPYLDAVGSVIRGSAVALGAQDVYHQPVGAFTGEVSPAMLLDLDVTHVIVGHSERRHVLGENDALIHAKMLAALEAGLTVIFCIGETLEQREQNLTEQVNLQQLEAGLAGVDAGLLAEGRVVIAYEPVWAIGTGKTAAPEDAEIVHARLRQALRNRYNEDIAESVRIQYGGSVKAANAATLAAQPNIDGFLVGGASLKSDEFLEIVRAALGNK